VPQDHLDEPQQVSSGQPGGGAVEDHARRGSPVGGGNPGVPDDVPVFHPLRSPAVVRSPAPSPEARDLSRLADSELRRLLCGTPLQRDVLGLHDHVGVGTADRVLRQPAGSDRSAGRGLDHPEDATGGVGLDSGS